MNEVKISGRLVRDPEINFTEYGTITNFSIAHTYKPKRGDKRVNYFDIVAWRDIADSVDEKYRKGDYIEIKGYLEQKIWTNKEGVKRSRVVINAMAIDPGKWNDVSGDQAQASPEEDDDIPF